ncbi:unnamed protein product [Brachionus calyciflorus]|uniref:Uncharacterized protein n=1 Tax=Brachionus calyciflorus TaxID=104777 RepID=A0A813YCX2_9BILA|nr:unnamed protein product [Brachionus calyciflorus]
MAESLIGWNLALINYIILPMYLKSVKHFKKEFEGSNDVSFIKRFFSFFPDLTELDQSIKPYFETFGKRYYKNIASMKIIPILDSRKKIEWCKPNELYFSIDFENYINSRFYRTADELIDIIWNCNIKICNEIDLKDTFRKNSGIELKLIDANAIINGLILFGANLIGKKIENSVFKNKLNLITILSYCKAQNEDDKTRNLEGCPLLLKQDMTVSTFDSLNIFLIHENPKIFKGQESLFLNEELYEYFKSDKIWFRKINTSDLKKLVPCFLSRETFLSSNPLIYSGLDSKDKSGLIQVWNLIINSFNKINDLNKNQILKLLKPIENWKLIPIRYINSNITYLAPLKEANSIIYHDYNKIFDLIKNIDFPVLYNPALWPLNFPDLMKKILIVFTRNDDLLSFLEIHEAKFDKIFTNSNSLEFLVYFNQQLNLIYNRNTKKLEFILEDKRPQIQIKNLIKSLPIFQDFYDKFQSIDNQIVYLVDFNKSSEEIKNFFKQKQPSDENYLPEFLEFSNKNNCVIIEYDGFIVNLYKYLDIEPISIERLYYLFFKWIIRINDLKLLEFHVNLLKTIGLERLKKDTDLWNLLKDLKFIKIGDSFYSSKEIYDSENRLYSIAFKEQLLPSKYNSHKWKLFLIELGLKRKLTKEDMIKALHALKNVLVNKFYRAIY